MVVNTPGSNYKQEDLKEYFSSLYEESSGTTIYQLIEDIKTKLRDCGQGRKFSCRNIECREQGNIHERIVRQYCGYRICGHPGCRAKRSSVLQRKIEPKLNSFKDPRFITLTLKGHHPLDRKPHDKLNYAWKRMSRLLRKSGVLKSYIKVTEIMHKPELDCITSDGKCPDLYFWHLHIVYDGVYIPFDILQKAWLRYTGDSNWVNITRVKKNISAAAYLRKYLDKVVYDKMDPEDYFKVFKIKFLSTYGCKPELETLLELSVLVFRLECPYCGSRLLPDDSKSFAVP